MSSPQRPLARLFSRAGFTATEVIVVTAITAIIAIPISGFMSRSLRQVTTSGNQLKSQEALRIAMDELEHDFLEMNEILRAKNDRITFLMDSNRNPAYSPQEIVTPGGPPRIEDPDDDEDVTAKEYSLDKAWLHDWDLADDDDNEDGKMDVRCRYRLNGRDLIKEFRYDSNDWSTGAWQDSKILISGVSSLEFSYFGNAQDNVDVMGRNVDDNSDGIITAQEIDKATPGASPPGHGDNSGGVNPLNDSDFPGGSDELRYVTSVRVKIALDLNKDGKEDFRMETHLSPPLMPIKRRLF